MRAGIIPAAAETDFLPGVGAARTMIVAVAADLGADQERRRDGAAIRGDRGGRRATAAAARAAFGRRPGCRRRRVARRVDRLRRGRHAGALDQPAGGLSESGGGQTSRRGAGQWVRMGGTLVVCVGAQAREFRPDGGLLRRLRGFCPGSFNGRRRAASGCGSSRCTRRAVWRPTARASRPCRLAAPRHRPRSPSWSTLRPAARSKPARPICRWSSGARGDSARWCSSPATSTGRRWPTGATGRDSSASCSTWSSRRTRRARSAA